MKNRDEQLRAEELLTQLTKRAPRPKVEIATDYAETPERELNERLRGFEYTLQRLTAFENSSLRNGADFKLFSEMTPLDRATLRRQTQSVVNAMREELRRRA